MRVEAQELEASLQRIQNAITDETRDIFRKSFAEVRRNANGDLSSPIDRLAERFKGLAINSLERMRVVANSARELAVSTSESSAVTKPVVVKPMVVAVKSTKPVTRKARPRINSGIAQIQETGLKFNLGPRPESEEDWMEIVLAIVRDQGQVALSDLCHLAKTGQRVIFGFETSMLVDNYANNRLLAAVVALSKGGKIRFATQNGKEIVEET